MKNTKKILMILVACMVLVGTVFATIASAANVTAGASTTIDEYLNFKRVTYDNILRLSDDPDVNDVIKFLRQREIVHFQRFGEAMQLLREKLDQRNVYRMNPAMDL